MHNKPTNTKLLVDGAMLIALATILSYIKFGSLPFGGSITLKTIPIVIYGFRNGPKWGLLTGFTYGLLQMILGFSNVVYCTTFISQIGCIVLDYLLAYSLLGLGRVFGKIAGKNFMANVITGSVICCLLQFICAFLSGWLLWSSYAPEGMNTALYSLLYNGSYMLPNTVILLIVMIILSKTAPQILRA